MELHILYHIVKYSQRALKSCFLVNAIWILIFLLPVFGFAQGEPALELDIEELRRRILGEAPQELMTYSLGDSVVSLFLTGSWKGDLQGNLGFFFSPVGTGFVSPDTPLLFKQEVDLTMSLFINDRRFVEVNFLDDSNQNTYRAGYQGLSGEFLQYAGIGNTGLDFPVFPYLDLGGDSPSSFGFYSRFGINSSNVSIHSIIRYDAASREERVFSGSRERTYSDIQPLNTIRGISFVLPDEDIDSDIIVYIEDEKGTILDSDGRRWRFALPSEYAVSKAIGLLELSIRPYGMTAVVYSKGLDNTPWINSMGSYTGTPYGYLTEVQQWFGEKIDLTKYPHCGGGTALPGQININNSAALVIYEPGTFSPFERRNRYDSPSSTSEAAALIRLSSGTEINGFELVPLENTSFIDIPLSAPVFTQRKVYELVRADSFNRRHPGTSWPLAIEYPEIYLSPDSIFTGDVTVRFTNFNSTSGYFIGTDVIPGSIQVWRSGIQDTNFNYNQSSGEVYIHGAVGQNEIIRVTYLKRSDGTNFGSIAAGVGAIYDNKASPFSARAALGIRWNLSDDSFTDEHLSSTGTMGISANAAWDFSYFKAGVSAGFTFSQTDTTGLYRIAGMEGHEAILALPSETSFISNPPDVLLPENKRADLIYRNYFSNNVLGSNLMSIEWNAPVISGINRPYPVKDQSFGDVQLLAAEFKLDSEENWTGFQVPLGVNGEIISRAGEIDIPFRFYGFNGDTGNFKLIIQIGALSGRDFQFIESPGLIWEKQLFPADWDFDQNVHIAKFTIDEWNRRKLTDVKYMRVIMVYSGTEDGVSGRVLMAPPIIRGSAFRPITYENGVVSGILSGVTDRITVFETRETGINTLESAFPDIIKRLHPVSSLTNTQRVLEINWKDLPPGVSAGIDGRFTEIPLADYRELSFFIKGPLTQYAINGDLHFIIAAGSEFISNAQLDVKIPLSAFTEPDAEKWKKVTIRYQGNNTGITIDGYNTPGASFTYRPLPPLFDGSKRTSYLAVIINPGGASLEQGTLYIDEIILEDALLINRMNTGAIVEYSKPGTIFSIGGISVLSDFSVYSAVEAEARTGIETQENYFSAGLASRTRAEISVLGMKITGNLAFTAAEDTFIWDAEHAISRTIGAFSFKETFYASHQTNTVRHNLNLAFASDFFMRFDADALYDYSRLRQRWNLGIGYRPKNEYIPALSVNTEAIWTSRNSIDNNLNYGEIWIKTFAPLIPDTGNAADTRRTNAQIIINQRTKPVGAVLTINGGTNFSGVNNLTRSENSGFLDIPVLLNRANLNFRAGRRFIRELYFYGNNVLDDSSKFFENLEDSLPVWTLLPVYSLFSDETNTLMDRLIINSPSSDITRYSYFNDHFSTRIILPSVYNLSAFFIPVRMTFRIERILEQKMDVRTDMLNLSGAFGFSAINMFGAMGYSPVFKFYQTDEFAHALEAAVLIPKNEDVSWRVSSVLNASFRGYTGGVFNIVNALTIRSGGNWIESFNINWETPTEKSLLSVFYNWIASSVEQQGSWNNLSLLLNRNYEQLRRESLEVVFNKSTDHLRWSITAGHEEIIRILGRLNFTAFLKLRFSEDLYTNIFTIDAKLGTTLRIIF